MAFTPVCVRNPRGLVLRILFRRWSDASDLSSADASGCFIDRATTPGVDAISFVIRSTAELVS